MSNENKKNSIICRCEDISLEEIERVIDEGYTNLEEIKRSLRCGMGSCQGRTCLILIARTVSSKTGRPISQMRFPTVRPPIRPVRLAIFATSKLKKKLQHSGTESYETTRRHSQVSKRM